MPSPINFYAQHRICWMIDRQSARSPKTSITKEELLLGSAYILAACGFHSGSKYFNLRPQGLACPTLHRRKSHSANTQGIEKPLRRS